LKAFELFPGNVGYFSGLADQEDAEVVLFAELSGQAFYYFGSIGLREAYSVVV